EALSADRSTLAEAVDFRLYPQVLINVRVSGRAAREVVAAAAVQKAVAAAEGALKGAGRVLLRPSGTEPVIRVMVEGQSKRQVAVLAARVAAAVRAAG